MSVRVIDSRRSSATNPPRGFTGVTFTPRYAQKRYTAWENGKIVRICWTEEEAWVAVPGATFDWEDQRHRGAAA